jgi:hypothetical protein
MEERKKITEKENKKDQISIVTYNILALYKRRIFSKAQNR